MKILNLVQGSDEWDIERLNNFCASEAPVMKGASKFMSRNQLLDLKKGWQSNPISSFKEQLFKDGHESEELARPIIEMQHLEVFPPMVGKIYINGIETPLLASFDGIEGGVAGNMPWEHKEWNATLSENVRNAVLEPQYYWQLEHQCLVNDSDQVLFTCSDGTLNKKVDMIYQSTPGRRAELIAGWKQFEADLAKHEIEAKQEVVVAAKTASVPVITFDVTGTEITSNIGDCLTIVTELAQSEMNKVLETDQDFANKDTFNKTVVKARADLKKTVSDVEGKFVSYADFASTAKDLDAVLQKLQSHGEKLVKDAKAAKKLAIQEKANTDLLHYLQECNSKITPMALIHIIGDIYPDWQGAMKNKRTIESLQNAIDTELANQKIIIDEAMGKILPNHIFLKEAGLEYPFLFTDVKEIINQPEESFKAVVNARIAEHKEREQVRADEIEAYLMQEQMDKEAKKAELKAQGDELIAYWRSLVGEANSAINHFATSELCKKIASSDCDEAIFGEGINDALDIYEACFDEIHDRHTYLRKKAEENTVATIASVDQVFEDAVNTGTGTFQDGERVDPSEILVDAESDEISMCDMDERTLAEKVEDGSIIKTGQVMPTSVKEFLLSYNKKNGYGEDDGDLIESLLESGNIVFKDGDLDMHRWYALQLVVVELEGVFIAFYRYIITGDNGMGDMDLQYNLDSMTIVQKRERTVTETYYE